MRKAILFVVIASVVILGFFFWESDTARCQRLETELHQLSEEQWAGVPKGQKPGLTPAQRKKIAEYNELVRKHPEWRKRTLGD